MATNEPAPEADALEQAQPVDATAETLEVTDIRPDVPEADALEQTQPVADQAPTPIRLGPDVPEADALDQSLPAGPSDDEEWS